MKRLVKQRIRFSQRDLANTPCAENVAAPAERMGQQDRVLGDRSHDRADATRSTESRAAHRQVIDASMHSALCDQLAAASPLLPFTTHLGNHYVDTHFDPARILNQSTRR